MTHGAPNAQYAQRLACCVVGVLLAACSLAEDTTPPPGSGSSLSPTPTTIVEVSVPAAKPSVATGAALYAANCVRCHGEGGAGDGELVSQLQFPPTNFTDPALAFNSAPEKWYFTITNGNIERLMPPWKDALSESERWDLVAHLFSLTAPANRLEMGQQIYKANCADCHGEGGAGDGPEASGNLPDFTDQAYMIAHSNADFLEAILRTDHSFASLPEDDRLAVIQYVRSLSFDLEVPEVARGTVTGSLSNGSTGGIVPAGLPVELRLFDNFQPAGSLTTTLQSDNTFEFADVALPPGRALIVTIEHDNVLYSSEVGEVTPDQTDYELPITIYDATSDTSAVSVDRMHVVFEENEGVLQIGELYTLSNNSDKTVRAETEAGPVVSFGLPATAASIVFQDGEIGERYLKTDSGFADTLPVGPGSEVRQVLVSYKLPYNGSLSFAHPITLATGTTTVLLPDSNLTLSGPNLVDSGVQTISGASFRSYTITGLQPGDTLQFEVRGGAALPPIDWRSLLIGGLSLVLVGAVIAYWSADRKQTGVAPVNGAPRSTSSKSATRKQTARRDELLAALAELDDRFENGEQPEANYRKEREKLKSELKRLLEKQLGS